MKKMFKAMSLLLVLAMLLSFAACGPNEEPTGNVNDPTGTTPVDSKPTEGKQDPVEDVNKYADIAGEYLLDGANLGMPMKWYIKVTADGKFVISTTRTYETLKGEGSIGDKDGTYMFMYSDSTQENPKTSTFTFIGKNMVFSNKIYVGSAGLDPNVDEGKYPTAKIIACEDILGTYMGEYVKESAMAGTVVYSYELSLGYGLEYTFSSSFAMMGSTYSRVESGSFEVDGSNISFTAAVVDGEAVEAAAVSGTIADGAIKAPFKLSVMASEAQEVEAKLAIYAAYAGTYSGLYAKAMGPMVLSYETILELDAFGGYKYYTVSTDDGAVDYTEEGAYSVADGKFSFQPATEGAAASEGTLANYVLKAQFPISAMVSTPVALDLYAEEVSGTFSSTGDFNGKVYTAVLEMHGNCFVLTVSVGEDTAYVAKGTFEIQKAMTTNVVLSTAEVYAADGSSVAVPAELATVSAPVAETGINANLLFDLDDAATLGFQLEK